MAGALTHPSATAQAAGGDHEGGGGSDGGAGGRQGGNNQWKPNWRKEQLKQHRLSRITGAVGGDAATVGGVDMVVVVAAVADTDEMVSRADSVAGVVGCAVAGDELRGTLSALAVGAGAEGLVGSQSAVVPLSTGVAAPEATFDPADAGVPKPSGVSRRPPGGGLVNVSRRQTGHLDR